MANGPCCHQCVAFKGFGPIKTQYRYCMAQGRCYCHLNRLQMEAVEFARECKKVAGFTCCKSCSSLGCCKANWNCSCHAPKPTPKPTAENTKHTYDCVHDCRYKHGYWCNCNCHEFEIRNAPAVRFGLAGLLHQNTHYLELDNDLKYEFNHQKQTLIVRKQG